MSLSPEEQSARAALRARQGKGARYDAPKAPHEDLLLARRGAAYFARKLGELSDDDLNAPSLRAGWTRRHLIAHVGYHARALARLVESARTGVHQDMYVSEQARLDEIDLGATLPARALRSLVYHATIHLDVEWRDLTDSQWQTPLMLSDGTSITTRKTPHLRASELHQSATHLNNGVRSPDFPTGISSW